MQKVQKTTLALRSLYLKPYIVYFTKIHSGYIQKYNLDTFETRDNFFLMESNKILCSKLENVEMLMLDEHIDFIRQHEKTIQLFEHFENLASQGMHIKENNNYLKMKKFFYCKLVDLKKMVNFAKTYLCFFRNFITDMDVSNTYTTVDYFYLRSIIIFKEIWKKFFMRSTFHYTMLYKIFIILEDTFYNFTISEQQFIFLCFEQESSLTYLMQLCNYSTFICENEFFLDNILINAAADICSGNLLKFKNDFVDYIATEEDLFDNKIMELPLQNKKRTFPVELEEQ